jgi:DNA replication protein DnaC
MILEETLRKMNQMKFYAMAHSLQERLSQTNHQDLSHEEFTGLLIDDEWMARENRKLKRRITNAKFKAQASLEAIDYQLKRGLIKKKLLDLATLKWIQHHQNLLLIGPTGVGKSFIAQALGHRACLCGFTAHYIRLNKLLNQLYLARAEGTLAKYQTQLLKYDLLIMDDWGLSPLKAQESQDLLEVIEDRHELKATIITSQLPTEHWHEFIGNETVADSLCDRLVHNAYKIELKGESVRKLKGRSKTEASESFEQDDLK